MGAIILPTKGVIREVNSSEQVEPKVPVGQPGELSISFLPSGHQTLSTSHESGTGDIQVNTYFIGLTDLLFTPERF